MDYQYVKLVDGAADSTAKIGGDATNGLDVDVTRIASHRRRPVVGWNDRGQRSEPRGERRTERGDRGRFGRSGYMFRRLRRHVLHRRRRFHRSLDGRHADHGRLRSSPTSVTDNDMGVVAIDVEPPLKVNIDTSPLDVAHDAADSGNPVKIGGRAANALPTAVANADRANAITDLFGRQLTAHIDPAMAVHKN